MEVKIVDGVLSFYPDNKKEADSAKSWLCGIVDKPPVAYGDKAHDGIKDRANIRKSNSWFYVFWRDYLSYATAAIVGIVLMKILF